MSGRILSLETSRVISSRYAFAEPSSSALKLTKPATQLDGAEVLLIDDKPPYVAVDQNAAISGNYQGLGTRQNS